MAKTIPSSKHIFNRIDRFSRINHPVNNIANNESKFIIKHAPEIGQKLAKTYINREKATNLT
jgi:hypothetical protein